MPNVYKQQLTSSGMFSITKLLNFFTLSLKIISSKRQENLFGQVWKEHQK